jgi:pantoate--beta-alanine ligase
MIVFKKAADIGIFLEKAHAAGKPTGFVPTMGALHAGHISLVEKVKQAGEICTCSIFVNPTQFNNSKDFDKYPVTIERDIDMLEAAGCDALFLPSVAEVYPGGTASTRQYGLGYLETVLEGASRPGHFQGVCQVVDRLLNIIPARRLYLGQKDYQQCMVINKMIEITGKPTRLVIVPTVREASGLAMSSRNMRLSENEKEKATALSRMLAGIKQNIKPGSVDTLLKRSIADLEASGFKVDYVSIADAETLELLHEWDGQREIVALVAAFLGEIRLIDNLAIN